MGSKMFDFMWATVFFWDTASQSTKSLDILTFGGTWPPWPPLTTPMFDFIIFRWRFNSSPYYWIKKIRIKWKSWWRSMILSDSRVSYGYISMNQRIFTRIKFNWGSDSNRLDWRKIQMTLTRLQSVTLWLDSWIEECCLAESLLLTTT